MGSTMDEVIGPLDQYSASVVHSAIMPAPVMTAITADATSAINRRTGSTGSLIGWPLIRIGTPVSSPSRAGLRMTNEP